MKKPRKWLYVLLIAAGAAVLTAGSVCMPKWVGTAQEMTDLNYGFPFPFLNQFTSTVFLPDKFPRYMVIQPFSGMFAYQVDWFRAAGSFVINGLIVGMVVFVIRQISFLRHSKKPGNKTSGNGEGYVRVYK